MPPPSYSLPSTRPRPPSPPTSPYTGLCLGRACAKGRAQPTMCVRAVQPSQTSPGRLGEYATAAWPAKNKPLVEHHARAHMVPGARRCKGICNQFTQHLIESAQAIGLFLLACGLLALALLLVGAGLSQGINAGRRGKEKGTARREKKREGRAGRRRSSKFGGPWTKQRPQRGN